MMLVRLLVIINLKKNKIKKKTPAWSNKNDSWLGLRVQVKGHLDLPSTLLAVIRSSSGTQSWKVR